MKNHHVQLEVLLMTNTTFTSWRLAEKEEPRPQDRLTDEERMEEACWNGMLQTILPEIGLQPAAGKGILYLWQIKATPSFLELELGEVPAEIDGHFSITPHSFLASQCYS